MLSIPYIFIAYRNTVTRCLYVSGRFEVVPIFIRSMGSD
uniref:Uncharacterized protein n=1 Tax=Anguilla anguilla TaxID=7936 RepID=A0A0E9W5Z5_ANGAN